MTTVQPADHDTVLSWSAAGLRRAVHSEPAGALLAADSWLVTDGVVRGYDAHWARFAGACGELGIHAAELLRFRAGVTAALPRRGRWFPRVELAHDAVGARVLLLRLRPAPPTAAREVQVLVAPPGDPRALPLRKGPDLELLGALRAAAAAAGAGEMLLCDGDGALIEGALSSLLWWEGETLCTTPVDRTLPGVTRGLLLELARGRGVRTCERSPLPAQLAGCETWLVSALHGIRAVSAWGPARAAACAAPRAGHWARELERTGRPLDAPWVG